LEVYVFMGMDGGWDVRCLLTTDRLLLLSLPVSGACSACWSCQSVCYNKSSIMHWVATCPLSELIFQRSRPFLWE